VSKKRLTENINLDSAFDWYFGDVWEGYTRVSQMKYIYKNLFRMSGFSDKCNLFEKKMRENRLDYLQQIDIQDLCKKIKTFYEFIC
jgi:hypothetical protein